MIDPIVLVTPRVLDERASEIDDSASAVPDVGRARHELRVRRQRGEERDLLKVIA